jgi:DNA modification methylase
MKFALYQGCALEIMPKIKNVNLIVTDPPYLLTSGGATVGGLQERIGENYNNGGNLFEGECPKWQEFMPLLYGSLLHQGHCYVMADSKNQFEMQRAALEAGFRFHNLLYWDKGSCTPNRWYMKNAEYVGLFFKGAAFAINNCSSKQGIYIPQVDESKHPTEKPVMLMKHYIENSTQPGQIVFDPFMGSGTTGVAAMLCGREFIGIERDEKWFAIAEERIKKAAKQKKQTKLC